MAKKQEPDRKLTELKVIPKFESGRQETFPAEILNAVVPILTRDPDSEVAAEYASGTAFCIASFESGEALFVTAAHTIEHLQEPRPNMEPFLLFPMGMNSTEEAQQLHAIRIRSISRTDLNTDIALLAIDNTTAVHPVEQFVHWTLDMDRLVEDEVVRGYGYGSVPHFKWYVPEEHTRSIHSPLLGATGPVTDVHSQNPGTNKLLSFPLFVFDAKTDHGMSGGPVVDEAGNVRGVISNGDTSAALIAGLIDAQIDLRMTADGEMHLVSIKELVDQGHIRVVGKSKSISIERSEDTAQVTWEED